MKNQIRSDFFIGMVNVGFMYGGAFSCWFSYVSVSFLKELSKREKKILSNNVPEKSLTGGRIFIIDENFLFFVFLVWTFT